MAQQVGSTSGTAPAARETEVRETAVRETEAGATEVALGGGSVVTEAGWPGGTGKASQTADGQRGIRVGRCDLDLASNDPLVGYLLSAACAVDITGLRLRSPALTALQAAGVVLVVPLISSGSLVGLLSLRSPSTTARNQRVLQTLAAPVTGLGHLMRGSKSGMKSQPNG